MLNQIREIASREPVRLRLYAMLTLVGAWAAGKGWVTPTDVDFYLAMAALVLAVETARSKVTPARTRGEHD